MFLIGAIAIVLFLVAIGLIIWGFSALADGEPGMAIVVFILAIATTAVAVWLQTHRIVPTQHVGVSRSTLSQDLDGLFPSGLMPKPFLGSVYQYPASSSYERCEQYTPAIKGSYGITLDLCLYYATGNIDWLKEINSTGSLKADYIMSVWRNSIVGDVAKSVKDYTPEGLSDNRVGVEQAIFKNISPWFSERGIPLVRISFKNWDFTSPDVAKSFDDSIVSQRKITEQTALFEAAKISRKRELYEAETAKQVAERQKESLNLLGLEGNAAVQYLWIKVLSESNKTPDVLILGGGNVPVSIPLPNPTPADTP